MPHHRRILAALVVAVTLAPALGAALDAAGGPSDESARPGVPLIPAEHRESPPTALPTIGGFAYADAKGARLMLLGQPDRPATIREEPGFKEMASAASSLKTAFCAGGSRVPVRFQARQRADGKGRGRQTYFEFDHLDGLVFSIEASGLGEGANCFVATDAYARTFEPARFKPLRVGGFPLMVPECDALLANTIAARRGRPVRKCWQLTAGLEPPAPIVLVVEFARQGDDALASVVVADGSRLIFADQHGNYQSYGETSSVWRADDAGVIEPGWFDVLLLARRGGEVVLAFSWMAPEGTMVRLVESDGDRFREVLGESWYQAPI